MGECFAEELGGEVEELTTHAGGGGTEFGGGTSGEGEVIEAGEGGEVVVFQCLTRDADEGEFDFC